MQRFVTYIYAYQNNDKNQNVGFAKVDIRGEFCQVEIHLKKTGYTNVTCPVYLLARTEKEIIGVEIGQISLTNGAGDFIRQVTCNQIGGSTYCMRDMKGIIILLNDSVMFASQWDKKGIQREQFRRYGEEMEESDSVSNAENVEESVPALVSENAESENEQPEEGEQSKERIQPEENVQITENSKSEEVVQSQEKKEPWQMRWEKLAELHGEEQPFENAPQIRGIRIELKDLRELPEQYWYLGSNSFLLHGFFNYSHLLLGRMDGEDKRKWFVGVPGVYQNQEKILAAAFGFPEFRQEKDTEAKTNQFGYWYRFMDE